MFLQKLSMIIELSLMLYLQFSKLISQAFIFAHRIDKQLLLLLSHVSMHAISQSIFLIINNQVIFLAIDIVKFGLSNLRAIGLQVSW